MTVHIKRDDQTAWCGQPLEPGFHFSGVEAAVLNGLHDKNPRACVDCTSILIANLLAGREPCNEN